MHALFLTSLGGGDGSLGAAFFFDVTGDEMVRALAVMLFFVDDFEGPTSVPLLLRFFLAEDLGPSGEADMPRLGL